MIGTYAETPPRFVRHVALLREPTEVTGGAAVAVYESAPPVFASPDSAERLANAHVVSDLALRTSESEAMTNWLARVATENRSFAPIFQQYKIKPHMEWVRASETNRRIRRRFSCAGFVLEAYRAAEIQLVHPNVPFPAASDEQLKHAYSNLFDLEAANPQVRKRIGFIDRADLGLTGDGPWSVLLPGYLFHAGSKATADIPRPAPFAPTVVAEAYFPKTATETSTATSK
ncbi:MAG: hypothetical protein HQ518_20375 [Rhodopirellula sp.]|nr:hypothetical protein [Rhodopirellula sp.]